LVSTLQCSRHGKQWHYHSILYKIMFIVCNDECMSGCSLEHKSCGLSRLLTIEGRCHVSSKFLFIFFSFEIPCNELLIYILVINFQYDSYTPCIVSMFLVMLWSSMLSFV
jgi:hypothetical protein